MREIHCVAYELKKKSAPPEELCGIGCGGSQDRLVFTNLEELASLVVNRFYGSTSGGGAELRSAGQPRAGVPT
jgi:hypothetical protein